MKSFTVALLCIFVLSCEGHKILAIFPYNGRSHHILFSSLVEELATRNNDVTVINYFSVKKMPNLRHISIQDESNAHCDINMTENLKSVPASFFVDFYRAYDMAVAFKEMANDNCQRLMTNDDIRALMTSGEKYDVVIVEQFVTDCGLAIAFKLNAPVVGMTAHVMMPWTYSRLGVSNNPAFVPNHMFATGTNPSLWKKIQGAIINFTMNIYYKYAIQRTDQEIVNKVYPDVPDLESLGKNISLIMINQYFPLTGSRLQGANVVEIGGMHVKTDSANIDKDLKHFLDTSDHDVVYISFGTVASGFPAEMLREIMAFVATTKINFIWKVDNITEKVPENLFMKKWLPQAVILCHPKVKAFVTHSGMLSTTEAMHCGVPVIAVPLFGDQFSNAQAAVEAGLGVALDIYTLDRNMLEEALQIVLQERFQNRAKELSRLWKDRPKSAMDTAVFWVKYVAEHKGSIDLRPPTVHLNSIQYFMLDVLLVVGIVIAVVLYAVIKLMFLAINLYNKKMNNKKVMKKKKD